MVPESLTFSETLLLLVDCLNGRRRDNRAVMVDSFLLFTLHDSKLKHMNSQL